MRSVAIAAGLFLAVGCGSPQTEQEEKASTGKVEQAVGSQPERKTFLIASQRYAVPAAHVRNVRTEPSAFLVIKHPEVNFELAYDRKTDGVRDASGAPKIFSLNDGEAPNIEYLEKPGMIVICRRAPAPRGGCGLKIRHGDAEWTLLFPRARLPETDLMVTQATSLLHEYRHAALPG